MTKYFLEYSIGGSFVPVPDDLGREVTKDRRTVKRLKTGATIDAYYDGQRVQVRMQKVTTGDTE